MQFKTVALAAVMAGLTVAQNATAPIPPVDPGSVDAQTKGEFNSRPYRLRGGSY